jgi:hypothetical protein
MGKVRSVLYAAATALALFVAMIGDAVAGPAAPKNFRCSSPPSSAKIDLAWDAVAPLGTNTGIKYRLQFKKQTWDLNVSSFTVTPSMVGGFESKTYNAITLQSVGETMLTGPTTILHVWIANPKISTVPTYCKRTK